MRRQRFLRASSAQSLCIFCACRLTGEVPTAFNAAPSACTFNAAGRQLHTGRVPLQSAGVAAAAPPDNDAQKAYSLPERTGFDPDSSLTAAEQRERGRLRQLRGATERGQQQQSSKQAEEPAGRQGRESGQKEEGYRRIRTDVADGQQGRTAGQRQREPHGATRATTGDERISGELFGGQRVQDRFSRALDARKNHRNERDARTANSNGQNARGGQGQGRQGQNRKRHDDLFGKASHQQRTSNPFASSASSETHRVSAPQFGSGAAATKDSGSASAPDGWGSGPVERAPLQYGEQPAQRLQNENENIADVSDVQPGHGHRSSRPQETDDVFARPQPEQIVRTRRRPSMEQQWSAPPDFSQTHNAQQPPPRRDQHESGNDILDALDGGAQQRQPRTGRDPIGYGNGIERTQQDAAQKPGRSRFSPSQEEPGWGLPAQSDSDAWGLSSRNRGQQQEQQQQQQHSSPRPRQQPQSYDPQSSHHDRAYQTTIVDAGDLHRPSEDNDLVEDQSANWQHIRRRGSEPAPQQRSQRQYQPPQQPMQDDPDWVDRKFAEHVQQRQQQHGYGVSPQPASPFERAINPSERWNQSPRPTQRCGRCGEMGHVARECNGPIRTNCNICGQPGHFARNCERNPTNIARQNAQNATSRGGSAQLGPQQRTAVTWDDRKTEGYEDRGHRGGGSDALSDVRGRVLRSPSRFEAEEEEAEDPQERASRLRRSRFEVEEKDEEPQERILRSRKFADEPRKQKGLRGRRGEQEEDEDDESGAAREEARARRAARQARSEKDRAHKAEKQAQAADRKAQQKEDRNKINLPEFVNVATLAQTIGVRYEQFVRTLERLGYDDIFPGKVLNPELSGMIAMEYDLEPVFESTVPDADERDLKARPEVEDTTFLPARPPVVTIMGHVDHGKTTILDYLRKSSVAAGEAGGITQHIGAFSVPLASSGKTITFLDTPGHAAFLAMRQRGANVTDIVILVVAGDDSVKPQTLEAIKHAQAAGVPMIVAVNKMDKEDADLQRVKQDLARHGVEIEDFGGETQVVPVSGKSGLGMEDLEENVVTLSEILDHRAETDGAVEGWVLEATTRKAGRVATVLVRRGTLKPGAVIVAGKTWARVRTLHNEAGQTIREVGPGMPVEVDGWRDQPAAGDEVLQAPSEQKASDVVDYRVEKADREKLAQDMEAINSARRSEQDKKEREKTGIDSVEATTGAEENAAGQEEGKGGQMSVPFIVKADVSGSAEAVSAYVLSVSSPWIAPRILRSGVGPVNEGDVELANAAEGHIISFNLPTDEGMRGQAEAKGVKVLVNNIIYRVLDDVKAVMEEKLPPIVTQRVLGEAEISAAFEIGVGGRKKAKIAGCKVRNGVVGRGSRVRVLRGSNKQYDGTIDSLKNVKKDVQEMRKGAECGMGFEDWEAFEVGDQIQTYEEVSEKRKL